MINLYKYNSYEINSDYNNIIKGSCLFFIDYIKLNHLDSFGIQSNKLYYFYEQIQKYDISTDSQEYTNMSLITNEYLNIHQM